MRSVRRTTAPAPTPKAPTPPAASARAGANSACLQTQYGGSLGCTSQDVKIASFDLLSVVDGCTGPSDVAQVNLRANLLVGANSIRDKAQIASTMDLVFQLFPRLQERRDQLAGTLSGGERKRLNAGLVLGATRWQLLRHTVLPSALPDFFTGTRVAVGFAWTTIVAAETSNGLPGIGGLAWATKKELRTDVAILCVIVIGVTAVLLDSVLRLVERRLVPWKGRA